MARLTLRAFADLLGDMLTQIASEIRTAAQVSGSADVDPKELLTHIADQIDATVEVLHTASGEQANPDSFDPGPELGGPPS